MPIERLEIFSLWTGFADPPVHAAKLVIARQAERFVRERLPEQITDEVQADLVNRLEEALARPLVRRLDLALFDIPESALTTHYGSMWTDDYPAHLVTVTYSTGEAVTICTEDQHAFMLPLKVSMLATGRSGGDGQARPGTANDAVGPRDETLPSLPLRRGGSASVRPAGNAERDTRTEAETFDPRLSLAIAALMPDGYLERDRLAGKSGILELNLHDADGGEESIAVSPVPEEPADNAANAVRDTDAIINEIYRVLSGVESPEEIAQAERAGRLSERLLKRISAEDARSLLSRGADPNIADEVGQTALMNAAWPPFDRERFRLLVQAGARLEARRNDGMTGLHIACAGGEADAAEEWVRAAADVSARMPDGTTPLMLGATWPRIVRALLAAGADVNAADDEGHTPLVYAVVRLSHYLDSERLLEALRELLGAGADVNRADRDGVTGLGHARRALARVELEEEVLRAFHPHADASRRQVLPAGRLAQTIVDLLAAAGARR